METDNPAKIIIGNREMTREEFFEEKERRRELRSRLSFEEKIKALVKLQEIALLWGNKKDVIVWRM
ncbi:MAG: hypothetical protein DRG40_05080 [Deltaproteobacteria bacterium]|nr:MAG: hypothetical protein DRG40_05080 [Deltaproteobacteria bacterium]